MKIKLNFGALLLLFSIILSNSITYASIYVFCAVIHELGHLAAARMLGIKIAEMSFDFAGAKIIPAGQINSYKHEFFLCAAGPLASILLSAISIYLLKMNGAKIDISYLYSTINTDIFSLDTALVFVFVFSVLQATINLIPISSFDGGRMLNVIITYFFGERSAYISSGIITFVLALILWMISVYLLIKIGQGLSLFSFSLCMFVKILENEK